MGANSGGADYVLEAGHPSGGAGAADGTSGIWEGDLSHTKKLQMRLTC